MIDEGEQAPTFELPAVVDGEFEDVSLDEYLGEDVVVLAFYPADFNPACDGDTTDLDELDLFTMQKDVSILAVSGDSIYSHRAFADEFDLHIPLLSDAEGTVAEQYGVESDADGYLTRRAIVVIDPKQHIEYTWLAEDVDELPDAEAIRDVVEGVGGDETAEARYRVAHAHYMEGRRAFTSAMAAFEDKEWMLAQGDFERAYEEFDRAADEFNTAARFGEDEEKVTYFERAERKAESLWRASEWLSESANAFASGEGAKAESMREDAETPLESARDVHEPPDPDDFPPEQDPADTRESEDAEQILLEEPEEDIDTSIGADIDADAADEETTPEADAEKSEDENSIDDEELEEIAAELEEQTEAAKEREQEDDDEPGTSGLVADNAPEPPQAKTNTGPSDRQTVDGTPADGRVDTAGNDDKSLDDGLDDDFDGSELDEDDIDLDLTDPAPDTEGATDRSDEQPDAAGTEGDETEDEPTDAAEENRIQFGTDGSSEEDDRQESDKSDE